MTDGSSAFTVDLSSLVGLPKRTRASYSATGPDGMIEVLRRVPSAGMRVDLNLRDTQSMIEWLCAAERRDYLAQETKWRIYRQLFEYHRDYLFGGDSDPYNMWPDDMIKLFVCAWWTMVVTEDSTETNTVFTESNLVYARASYDTMAEVLDVELV